MNERRCCMERKEQRFGHSQTTHSHHTHRPLLIYYTIYACLFELASTTSIWSETHRKKDTR